MVMAWVASLPCRSAPPLSGGIAVAVTAASLPAPLGSVPGVPPDQCPAGSHSRVSLCCRLVRRIREHVCVNRNVSILSMKILSRVGPGPCPLSPSRSGSRCRYGRWGRRARRGLPGFPACSRVWRLTGCLPSAPGWTAVRASYVAEAVTHDGTPVVLKVSIPPGIDEFTPFERQLAALRLAGGDPYVGLIRHDVPRQALLLERLGRPMASLGWPASRQMSALARTAARGWRSVPNDGRLPSGAEAARWHTGFITSAWDDLARPCPEAAVDLAVRCAAAREAAFDPSRAVLVHGDVHNLNALQIPGPAAAGTGFRLVDPGGLISEPAHDLGVIQARGVQGWINELAASDPQQALDMVTRSCWHAGRLTGSDPDAIWQWAFTEMVSTGLFILRLGHHQEAETFLAVAGKLAAATAKGQAGTARRADPTTPARVAEEPPPAWQPRRPPPAPVEVRPGPATLLLMVGLPGAGKTTRAKELAAAYRALRLTPDEWMIRCSASRWPMASVTCWKDGSSWLPCKRCSWGPTSCSTSGSGAVTNGQHCAGWQPRPAPPARRSTCLSTSTSNAPGSHTARQPHRTRRSR